LENRAAFPALCGVYGSSARNEHGAAYRRRHTWEGSYLVKSSNRKLKTVELKPDGTYGRFVGERSTRGFGITLGNSFVAYYSPRFPAWRHLR
jgi:hypothetical protein